jgi:hypothetical protein
VPGLAHETIAVLEVNPDAPVAHFFSEPVMEVGGTGGNPVGRLRVAGAGREASVPISGRAIEDHESCCVKDRSAISPGEVERPHLGQDRRRHDEAMDEGAQADANHRPVCP